MSNHNCRPCMTLWQGSGTRPNRSHTTQTTAITGYYLHMLLGSSCNIKASKFVLT